ncbi:MAG: hypothetical protein WD078_01895 [Woeseia sp.]
MNQVTHNKIVSFIWGIADDVLRVLGRRVHLFSRFNEPGDVRRRVM